MRLMTMAFHVRGGLFGFVWGILLGYSLKCSVQGFAQAFRSGVPFGRAFRRSVLAFGMAFYSGSGSGVPVQAFGSWRSDRRSRLTMMNAQKN